MTRIMNIIKSQFLLVPLLLLGTCIFPAELLGDHTDLLRFRHLTLKDGLSQSTIYSLCQDQYGFIWIGTEDGLNRYDGYSFKIYRPEFGNSTSISGSAVYTIKEDSRGDLWIGTAGHGLNRYNPETDRFQRFPGEILGRESIWDFYEDDEGQIWIGTESHGLVRMNPDTQEVEHFRHDPDDPASIIDDAVLVMAADSQGRIWSGTGNGLGCFDPKSGCRVEYLPAGSTFNSSGMKIYTLWIEDHIIWIGTEEHGLVRLDTQSGKWEVFYPPTSSNEDYQIPFIYKIQRDQSGQLWVCTSDGLNIYNEYTRDFFRFEHDINDPNSISGNGLITMMEDRAGMLWFGTIASGLNTYSALRQKFQLIQNNPQHPDLLAENHVYAICETQFQELWIGTWGGLTLITRTGVKHYRHKSNDPRSLSANVVWKIVEDDDGSLWIGTNEGLNQYNYLLDDFQRMEIISTQGDTLTERIIYSITSQDGPRLWLGTDKGLLDYDPQTQRAIHYKSNSDDSTALVGNNVNNILEDRDGRIWIGTDGNGLHLMDPESGIFHHYQHQEDDPTSLAQNDVMSLFEDHWGNLWIGTYGGGLNRWDPQRDNFTSLRTRDGLPNDVVYGILEDNQNNLWLSTNHGISRFSPATSQFRNYEMNDGLQDNEFNAGAYHIGHSGRFYFGGISGLNFFYPDSIKENLFVPPVHITDLKVDHTQMGPGIKVDGRIVLDQTIHTGNLIQLNHSQNFISFEFAALCYENPARNQYTYMLSGLDETWRNVGNRNFAVYTNLPGGQYTFMVRGSNSDGIWNKEGAQIDVIIQPPFWETTWFRVSLVFFGIFIILLTINLRTEYIRHHAQELEALVNQRTAELNISNIKLQNERDLFIAGPVIVLQWFFTRDQGIQFTYASPNLIQLGILPEDLLAGKVPYADLVVQEDLARVKEQLIKFILSKEVVLEHEFRINPVNSPEVWIFALTRYFPSREGKTDEYRSFILDISEVKRMQDKLQQKQMQLVHSGRLASLGEMASGIAHELNQPLSIIRMQAELIRMQIKPVEDELPITILDMNEIIAQVDRAAVIIDHMRTFARSKDDIQESIDVETTINRSLVYFREQFRLHGIQLILDIKPFTGKINANAQRLEQVLVNFFSNARYALDKRNQSGEVDFIKKIIVRAYDDVNEKTTVIEVSDNGCGMDEEEHDRCLDPFYTTKEVGEGTGLGLSIAYNIIQEYKGQIQIISEPDMGTTMRISFPTSK